MLRLLSKKTQVYIHYMYIHIVCFLICLFLSSHDIATFILSRTHRTFDSELLLYFLCVRLFFCQSESQEGFKIDFFLSIKLNGQENNARK